jgi:hypothetical protein
MKRPRFLMIALALFMAGIAHADGTRRLVIGRISHIGKGYVEVETEAKKYTIAKINAATRYTDSSTEKPAKLQDLVVGDQTVITVLTTSEGSVAQQVDFVPASPRSAPSSTKPK